VAAYLGTGHIETGYTVADFQAEQFERRHLEDEDFGAGLSEPEYFEMDEDRLSRWFQHVTYIKQTNTRS